MDFKGETIGIGRVASVYILVMPLCFKQIGLEYRSAPQSTALFPVSFLASFLLYIPEHFAVIAISGTI